MNRILCTLSVALILGSPSSAADRWSAPSNAQIDAVYPQVESLYMELHRSPELSLHEQKTAATIAAQLRRLGFDVTTGGEALGWLGC